MINICVIDDDNTGADILKSVFAGTDGVEISDNFRESADIIVYLSGRKAEIRNIRPKSVVIFSDNRLVKTDVEISAVICGLYEKSTVTASSIDISENTLNFVYCMQRSLVTLSGETVDIGEINVQSEWMCLDKVLAAITARIICRGAPDNNMYIKKL